MAGPRTFDLEGGCNFRDLGGYTTVDGRRVRRGLLFRSGVLAYLTAQDRAELAGLHVCAICDLRRKDERANEVTRWPDSGALRVLHWDDDLDRSSTGQLYASRTPGEARAAMVEFYRGMPGWLHSRLRGLFASLTSDHIPMVVHCSAGKDRTGLAAALLLGALGVPRETVLADYALTNEAVDLPAFLQLRQTSALGLGDATHPLLAIDAETRAPMLAADTAYLSAALTQIEQEYGSLDAYLRVALGVTDSRREEIQSLFLDGDSRVRGA